MNDIFISFIYISFLISIFSIILLLIKPFIKYRISKSLQYYIWIFIILRLLIPLNLYQKINNITSFLKMFLFQPNVSKEASLGRTNILFEHTLHNSVYPSLIKDKQVFSEDIFININFLEIIWVTIFFIMIILKVMQHHNLLKMLKSTNLELQNSLIKDIYSQVCNNYNIKLPPKLYLNKFVTSPMIVGLFHPIIVLPSFNFCTKEFEYIFKHELTHFKRHDLLYKCLVQICICLHWFNPLIYVINQELNNNCELSCDEEVIKHLNKQEKQQYGDTLLTILKSNNYFSNNFVSLFLNKDLILLKERLYSIVKFKKKTLSMTLFSFILITVLLLCDITTNLFFPPFYISKDITTYKSMIDQQHFNSNTYASIRIKKSLIDSNKSIKNIEVLGDVVNLNFETTPDDTFEASILYSNILAPLYEKTNLYMNVVNQTLTVGIEYPNGEINQTSEVDTESDGLATLLLKVPRRYYSKIKMTLLASNSNILFNLDTSSLILYKTAGTVSLTVKNKCNDIYIKNNVGDFKLNIPLRCEKIEVQNRIGNFELTVPNNLKETDLTIFGDLNNLQLPRTLPYKLISNEIRNSNANASSHIKIENNRGGITINEFK